MKTDKYKTEAANKEKSSKDSIKEVVLKVYVHCEGCSKKLVTCLKGFYGVEDVTIDNVNHRVTVRGQNVDPLKVLGRLEKKYSKNVELISPLSRATDNNDRKVVQEKKQEPRVETLVLKMYMHCEGCANDITRNIERMKGIMLVEADIEKSRVVIKGVFDAPKLVKTVTKRLGKHVEILKHESNPKSEQQILVPYYTTYIHPSSVLSDDNIFACSVM